MLRWIYLTFFLGVLPACVIWLLGFFAFVGKIPDNPSTFTAPVDAAVVLTGGSLRLEEGLRLLEEKQIKQLFISGVGSGVTPIALLGKYRYEKFFDQCCGGDAAIVLGYKASSTFGNAIEASEWLHFRGYKSARIITAQYHMPRSLKMFNEVMGDDIVIIPTPVFPESVLMGTWWQSPGTRTLLIDEYNKYLLSYVTNAFYSIPDL